MQQPASQRRSRPLITTAFVYLLLLPAGSRSRQCRASERVNEVDLSLQMPSSPRSLPLPAS